jgi:hypothetical protein
LAGVLAAFLVFLDLGSLNAYRHALIYDTIDAGLLAQRRSRNYLRPRRNPRLYTWFTIFDTGNRVSAC